MKRALQLIVIVVLPLILLTGCGERKNAADSGQLYQITSTLPPVGIFRHLYISQDLGYLAADYLNSIIVVDLQNPASPVVIDTISNYLFGPLYSCQISEETGFIYVESGMGANFAQALFQFELSTVDNYSGTVPFFTGSPPMEQYWVKEITHDSLGAALIDTLIFYINDNTETKKFQVQYAYTLGGYFGVYEDKGYQALNVYGFALSDDYAYLAVDEYGMVIVSLTASAAETPVVGAFDTEGFCRGIAYQDGYCYLADRHWGLQIVDVSDPANPVRTANLKFDGADDCFKVKILGDRAVVLDQYDGVFAVDVADPANPQLLFNFDLVSPKDMVLTENYIYVVDEDMGLITANW